MPLNISEVTFLRLPQVQAQVGLSRSQIYKLMAEERFPASKKIGTRIAVWVSSDIQAWKQARIDEWESQQHPIAA